MKSMKTVQEIKIIRKIEIFNGEFTFEVRKIETENRYFSKMI